MIGAVNWPENISLGNACFAGVSMYPQECFDVGTSRNFESKKNHWSEADLTRNNWCLKGLGSEIYFVRKYTRREFTLSEKWKIFRTKWRFRRNVSSTKSSAIKFICPTDKFPNKYFTSKWVLEQKYSDRMCFEQNTSQQKIIRNKNILAKQIISNSLISVNETI